MKKIKQGATYDDADSDSILKHARRIQDQSLRSILEIPQDFKPKGSGTRSKGKMGDNVEEYYFDIRNNNKQEPDFPKVNLELKTTGLIYTGPDHKRQAKERLAITSIDWMSILDKPFCDSYLYHKMQKILLMAYDYDKSQKNVFDMIFRVIGIWKIPDSDIPKLKRDWNTILKEVKEGKAHEISSRDTKYLEAATTGKGHGETRPQPNSAIEAKPRRWALKSSYVTTMIAELANQQAYEQIAKDENEENLPIEDLVQKRFAPYFGKTKEELKDILHINCSMRAKQFYAELTKKILGINTDKRIDEFEKANIVVRTIRQNKNGTVREHVSFPAINYKLIVNTNWADSSLYRYMTSLFLFVVFQENQDNQYLLSKLVWWYPTNSDMKEARKVFYATKNLVKNNDYKHFPKVSGFDGKGSHIHVRPHGTKKEVGATPQGTFEPKKSFWLTNKYVKSIIDKV
ncbi:Sau3AI family type II restriction endonuclease [Bifidobacterium sp. ESL0790]|uniref:Sau3AI family type II restriction endonuclease n=1 Tax=Bifidobacterium sp. ESL0790 TaxID=2983233 RepID=UPI0023F6CC20|nr:Sau3AI family type II restriction endonuclease [Bifidobacterium sp. ESL0790]WEV72759.1 Sau3AI family type II restriction endonuclease [Bifidobacterium sp. ESL0790]